MKNVITTALTVLMCVAATISVSAQTELGFNLGASSYDGDLAPSKLGVVLQAQASLGIYGRVDVGSMLAFRGFVQQSKIQGSDVNRDAASQQRNLNFRSNILEMGVVAEVYPLGTDLAVAPFISLGASVYNFNPETEYNGRWVELQPLGTEGQGLPGYAPKYGLTRFAVPIGIGVRYPMGNNFVLGAQGSARLTFFDHLDDVSGNYVNYYELLDSNGSLAAAVADRTGEFNNTDPRNIPTGSRRGDPTNNDWFYTATITIGYRLGSGLFNSGGGNSNSGKYNRCYQF
ncbi:MAG: DUF6089 family protein [Saprospiraceae bacterium]